MGSASSEPAAGRSTAIFPPSARSTSSRLSRSRAGGRRPPQLAADLDVPHAFGDYYDLIAHPDVDLVVIPTPGPEHAPLVRAAIGGGKDVYSEWPLSTTTAESEELLHLAEEQGVRHVVGLQRRFAPSASHARDLIRQGYVGTIRGVRMSVGVDAFAPTLPERYRWTIDEVNATNLLVIYGGHFFDLLFHLVGPPDKLTAIAQNQFPATTIAETGEQVPNTSAHEVVVIGTLKQDGLFSIQLEGAQATRPASRSRSPEPAASCASPTHARFRTSTTTPSKACGTAPQPLPRCPSRTGTHP